MKWKDVLANLQKLTDFYTKVFLSPIKIDELNEKHFPDYTYFDKIIPHNFPADSIKINNIEPILLNDCILNHSAYAYINSRGVVPEYIFLPFSSTPFKYTKIYNYTVDTIEKRIYYAPKEGNYEIAEKFIFNNNCLVATDIILEEKSEVDITVDTGGIQTSQSSLNYLFILNRNSKLNCYLAGLGSGRLFMNIYAIIQGSGAEVKIKGCFLNRKNDNTVIISYINHRAPQNISSVHINNVLLGKSTNFFLGLIKVEKAGEGVDAFETNKNLLLSRDARVLSIPKLEIENNNLRCSHASTVSSIDEDLIFYLNSRGIEYKDVVKLSAMGFLMEPFESEKYANLIEEHLTMALGEMEYK